MGMGHSSMAGNKPNVLESETLTDPDFYRSFNLKSFIYITFFSKYMQTGFKVITGATSHQGC